MIRIAFLLPLLAAASAAAQQVCDTVQYPLSSPTSRFEDHGDGTVTDKESGLMWLRCSAGQQWNAGRCSGEPLRMGWPAAQAAAAVLNRSGAQFFNDWRLPTLPELATITERQCRQPRANLAMFPGMPALPHWTSTPRPGTSVGPATAAYTLSFGDEGIEYRPAEQLHAVRFVRRAN